VTAEQILYFFQITVLPKQVLWQGFRNIAMKLCRLFQITNLMHNSFILQQYVCYTTILNMFRAARCTSSGGPIVSP